ncbi:hypothetical protein MBLNU457_4527t1 [Dothideomycetes sp. NU457]
MPPRKRPRNNLWLDLSSFLPSAQRTRPLVEHTGAAVQHRDTSARHTEAPAASHEITPPDVGLVNFLIEYHDVRHLILDWMNTRDFAMLCATNKVLRKVLFEERFDINQHLKRYFRDPLAFRRLLQKSGSFVSGTFPLSVFEGRVWRGGELRVYVSKDYLRDFGKFLTREKSYVECAYLRGERVWVFKRTTPGRRTETVVIVRGSSQFFLDMLENEHFTPELCLMTWNKLVCLFPYVTFQQHKMYSIRVDPGFALFDDVFEENGWPPEDIVQLHCPRTLIDKGEDYFSRVQTNSAHSSCSGTRRVGDKHAYHVRLDTDGMDDEATSIPSEVLDYCNFRVPFESDECDWADLCIEVHHPLLRWTYASACVLEDHNYGDNPRTGEVFSHIWVRLDRLLAFELSKLPPDQRPVEYHGAQQPRYNRAPQEHRTFKDQRSVYSRYSWDSFEKPTTWRYLDHMIPEWYAIHERDGEFYQAHLRQECYYLFLHDMYTIPSH